MTTRLGWILGLVGLASSFGEFSLSSADGRKSLPPGPTVAVTKVMNTNVVETALAEIRQRNFPRALQLLQPAAEAGDSDAQALLGQMFQAGWGMPTDYQQAFKWWSRAAEKGSSDAQWGLGLLYNDGKGVKQDDQKAAEWWKKGANQGNIKATVNLAFLYEEGRGVAADPKECARLFKLAAESGEPFAQAKYGFKLLTGEGVVQNNVHGAAWIAVAAESPRVRQTPQEGKFLRQKDEVWERLSATEQKLADSLKLEINKRLQTH